MAIERLHYHFSGNGTYYIDLARDLSIQTRKLNRQLGVRTVYGGLYEDKDGSKIHINVAPNQWPTRLAVKRLFKAWKKHTARTLEGSGSMSPKYNDFKLYLNEHHDSVGANNIQIACDAAGIEYTQGEWDYSTLMSDDPNPQGTIETFDMCVVGGEHKLNPNGVPILVSACKSWLSTRAEQDQSGTPVPPAGFATDPITNLFDSSDIHDDRMTALVDENDRSPYPEAVILGCQHPTGTAGNDYAENLQLVSMGDTTNGAIVSLNGFQAINGLLQVVITGGDTTAALVLDVETKVEAL